MSGADAQRAAEPDQCRYCPNDADRDEAGFLHCIECRWTDNPGKIVELCESLDGLRAELAETRDRRDYLQGQLDIIHDAEYSRNDALKRRIEKLGTAGDALFAAGRGLYDEHKWPDEDLSPVEQAYVDAEAAWRSVRGDAPTQPPAPMPYAWGGGDGGRYFPTVEAPAVTRTDGQPPAAPRELPFREDDLAEGMQRAWNDVVGDVGHIPEDFTVRPRTAKVTADFLGGSFARSVLGYLQSVAAAPAVARTDGQPPAGYGPCRDCPPPGQFEVVCGFCGEEVPTLAQVEDGLVEWPTDDEQGDR